MSHTTRVVEIKQISDEAITVRVRCCANPKTDSVLTIYGVAGQTKEQIEAQIDKHHDRVAGKCAGMATARTHLESLATQVKEHK